MNSASSFVQYNRVFNPPEITENPFETATVWGYIGSRDANHDLHICAESKDDDGKQ
jgi:hypothetical protein